MWSFACLVRCLALCRAAQLLLLDCLLYSARVNTEDQAWKYGRLGGAFNYSNPQGNLEEGVSRDSVTVFFLEFQGLMVKEGAERGVEVVVFQSCVK